MSVYFDRQLELERYEFQFGQERGRLAVTLDVLTDALILVGQHGVYCASERDPKLPKMDLQRVVADIEGAKQLVADVMGMLGEAAERRRAEARRGQDGG